ncbi:unnamed protein product [Ceutorhynchus assimilis]|uniref:Uncharacterized protein n=1 Tax=Ceutorhynchus assimilis TaxID=467358 RepID=A0A9N9MJ45_9CUCU|nr:unnamed protein product [Ceutorhynchus assimilis]
MITMTSDKFDISRIAKSNLMIFILIEKVPFILIYRGGISFLNQNAKRDLFFKNSRKKKKESRCKKGHFVLTSRKKKKRGLMKNNDKTNLTFDVSAGKNTTQQF